MDADAAETHSGAARPAADAKAAQSDEHERGVEDREAFEAWDYMFKPDKTGTDKLKALLRGLKNVIVSVHLEHVVDIHETDCHRMRTTSHPTTQT